MTKVFAPNRGYDGLSAGVQFKNGVANTDDPRALAYFARAGYGIGAYKAPPAATPAVDARDAAERVVLGTPLRDAAVDPRPGDFLPPVNAGQADPHGPLVVAPGIHGVGPAPIRPGAVHVDDVRRQNDEETELAARVLVEGEPATIAAQIGAEGDVSDAAGRPAKSATKAAWVDYAVSRGLAREEAEDLTITALQERFGA